MVAPGSSEGDNVLPVTVNGSLCSADSYINPPVAKKVLKILFRIL